MDERKCDRCGKVFECVDDTQLIWVSICDDYCDEQEGYSLCPDCMDKLKLFLSEKA